MEIIELIIMLMSLIMAFVFIKKSWTNSIAIDPKIAIVIPAFLLLVIPASIDDNFEISLSVLVYFSSILLIVSISKFIPLNFYPRIRIFSPIIAKNIIIVLSFLYFFTMAIEAYSFIQQFGFFGSFTRDRLADYFSMGLSEASIITPIRIATELAFFIFLGTLLSNKKFKLFIIIFTSYIIFLSIVAITRLSIVIPLFCALGFWINKNNFRFKRIAIVMSISSLLAPLYVYNTNLIRHGISISEGSYEGFREIENDTSRYNEYLSLIENYTNYQGYENGKAWFLGSIGNIVPRFLWPEKPVTSTSNRITEQITGFEPSINNPVITFTIIGEGFLQFGYIGIFIEVLLFFYFFKYIYEYVLKLKKEVTIFPALYICCIMAVYFRAEIPFTHLLFFFVTVYIASLAYDRTTSEAREVNVATERLGEQSL